MNAEIKERLRNVAGYPDAPEGVRQMADEALAAISKLERSLSRIATRADRLYVAMGETNARHLADMNTRVIPQWRTRVLSLREAARRPR